MIDGSIKCPSCANVNAVQSDLELRREQERTNFHLAESLRLLLTNIHETNKLLHTTFTDVLAQRRMVAG